jgi:hypothetical protein
MSALRPKDHIDPQDPLYYAPKWLRDRPEREARNDSPTVTSLPVPKTTQTQDDQRPRYENQLEDAVAKALEDPIEPSEFTPELPRRRPLIGILGFIAAIALTGGAALYYFSGPKDQTQTADAGVRPFSTQSAPAVADTAPPASAESALVVQDGSGEVNEPLPLGVNVTALTPGATVILIGLPNGARLSPGNRVVSGEWLIGLGDLPMATVIPPRDYVGSMNIAAELRGSDGRVLSKSPVQLIWKPVVVAAPAPAPAPRKVAAPAVPEPHAVRQIAPEEIATLVRRGEELARSGDLAAARLLLQRAAEAHNARAAFVLAATYDPIIIEKIATASPMADVEMARVWYQRAQDWGSAEASKQLEALASMRR